MTISNNLTCYRTNHEHTQPASSTSTQYSDALRTEAMRDETSSWETGNFVCGVFGVVGGTERNKHSYVLHYIIVSFRLPVLLL